LLRCTGTGGGSKRRIDELAGVQRRGFAYDAGTCLDPDSKTDRARREGEAGASPKTGTIAASAARAQGDDAARNLECGRYFETRRAGFAASVDESGTGATNRDEEVRPVCFKVRIKKNRN